MDLTIKKIYALIHPVTKVIVYVGRTKNMRMRVSRHYNSPTPALLPFITELKALGLRPLIKKLDKGTSYIESYWINKLLSEGHPLLNRHQVWSPENRNESVQRLTEILNNVKPTNPK